MKSSTMAEKSQSHFKDWPNAAAFTTMEEQTEVKELQVKGRLPTAVAGVLYRTGPCNYILKDAKGSEFKYHHWFDGFSQIYRFQIVPDGSSCRVLFNSRRQTDELVDHIRKTGKTNQVTFAQKRDPCASFFSKAKSAYKAMQYQTDRPGMVNAEVTIGPSLPLATPEFKQRTTFTSRTDTAELKEIDAETLEPIGLTSQKSLNPELDGILSSAHAQFDPVTGDCYNFNLAFGMAGACYKVFCTSASTGKTEILAKISGSDVNPAYLHSLFLSENYVILCIWTSYFAGGGSQILWERNLLDAISPFDPKATTRWYVIDRKQKHGVISTFESPAMFAFHTINAFEIEGPQGQKDIYCDVVDYPSLDILHRLYYDNLMSTGPGVAEYAEPNKRLLVQPSFSRFRLRDVLSKQTNAKAERAIRIPGPSIGELPVINPHFSTKKSRFVYSVVDRGLSSLFDGIVKTDVESGEVTLWTIDKHTPGEPIFVTDPGADSAAEDDGYLLSVVLDGNTGSSYLLCLDAKTMEEVGRAESGIVIGAGFHGKHVRK